MTISKDKCIELITRHQSSNPSKRNGKSHVLRVGYPLFSHIDVQMASSNHKFQAILQVEILWNIFSMKCIDILLNIVVPLSPSKCIMKV